MALTVTLVDQQDLLAIMQKDGRLVWFRIAVYQPSGRIELVELKPDEIVEEQAEQRRTL